MTIESAVREALVNCGKSQSQLSRDAGLSQPSVSYFMRGKMHLSGDKLQLLAMAAGVQIVCKPLPKRKNNGNRTKTNSGQTA